MGTLTLLRGGDWVELREGIVRLGLCQGVCVRGSVPSGFNGGWDLIVDWRDHHGVVTWCGF